MWEGPSRQSGSLSIVFVGAYELAWGPMKPRWGPKLMWGALHEGYEPALGPRSRPREGPRGPHILEMA